MKKRFSFILLGLLSLLFTSCGIWMSRYPDADKYVSGNQTYNEEVNSIDIDWLSGTVKLVEDNSLTNSVVKIEEETDCTKEEELVHSYLNEGKLMIKFFASGYRCTNSGITKKLIVTYAPGLESIKVNLTSGSLNAESITARDINVDLTSGKVVAGEIISERVKFDLTSGSVNIDSVYANDFDIDLTSGSANIKSIFTEDFDADLTSGSLDTGFGYVKTASYDLTSGDIKLTLPNDGGKVRVEKTSGKVNTERECTIVNGVYKFGDGEAMFDVTMTSGTLTIK